jgi:ABC-type nitrate/sulfonate/bicarbonate transport system substrate-binding protein
MKNGASLWLFVMPTETVTRSAARAAARPATSAAALPTKTLRAITLPRYGARQAAPRAPRKLGRVKRLALVLVALLALAASAGAQTTAPLAEISVTSVGPGAPEWGIYIGEERGFFAKAGLHITESQAGNTQNAVNALVTGDAPLAILASDVIVVANAHNLPIKYIAPLVVIPTYALVVRPEIKSWNDLKGKVVLVTNKEDITAIMLRRLAESQHLDWLRDFDIILSGTSQLRTQALISGNAQGAMLTGPYDVYAARQGMHVLARASDVVKEWVSNGLAVNPKWADAHRPELIRFLRALRDATQYGYDHPDDAVAIMAARLKLQPADAQITYDATFKTHGLSRDLIVNERGLANVVNGVVQMGTLASPLPLSSLVDSSFAREAFR